MRLKVSNVCQLLNKSEFRETHVNNGITYTNNGDGTFTVNGTTTSASASSIYSSNSSTNIVKTNHKYLMLGFPIAFDGNNYVYFQYYPFNTSIKYYILNNANGYLFFTPADDGDRWNIFYNLKTVGFTINNITVKPQLFDLTKMYGAGNEPTTVAQFRQDFPNEMYEYSPVCWKKFRRLKYVTETKNLFKLNDFSNSWLTIKNNTIRIKKTSDLQSYADAIFSPLQTDLKSDKYYRISAKVIGEFTGRVYKFFGNSLWGNAINNNRWQSDFTLATVEDKYGLAINQNSGTTVGCTLISDEVFIYDIMLEESDTTFVGQAEYVPSGYLPLNRGKYIANKEPVQLLDKSKYPVTTTNKGITITNNGDGSLTLNGTATSDGEIYSLQYINLINGHKYFIYDNQGGSFANIVFTLDAVGSAGNREGNIWTCNITSGPLRRNAYFYVVHGTVISNRIYKPQLFDLTEMYGGGNEPTTVEQFRADFPNELYDYNPYNAITFR